MIRYVTDSDLEAVRAFLEAHVDTSLFLLSNLTAHGLRLGEHPNSGNFQLVEEAGLIAAVFCLTRRGNLLIQAGGRSDLAEQIFYACGRESVGICGIAGEWPTAQALWELLRADPGFEPTCSLKDVLYELRLDDGASSAPVPDRDSAVTVRALEEHDFLQWEPLNAAYFAELHLPTHATLEQRRTDYLVRARSGLWWGAFETGANLSSIASLNATYTTVGQVGGVYTRPDSRRAGLGKAVMRRLILDCRQRLGFERLILFTGEDNHAARRLYESLGFTPAGEFGLLLGERRAPEVSEPLRHAWVGQSGESYTYEIYEWPARLSAGPGNYVFATGNPADGWLPVLIGECADLSTLELRDRAGSGAIVPLAPTHVHVRSNLHQAAVRRREASDLAARWLPDQGL